MRAITGHLCFSWYVCCTEPYLCLHLVIQTKFWGPFKFELTRVYYEKKFIAVQKTEWNAACPFLFHSPKNESTRSITRNLNQTKSGSRQGAAVCGWPGFSSNLYLQCLRNLCCCASAHTTNQTLLFLLPAPAFHTAGWTVGQ